VFGDRVKSKVGNITVHDTKISKNPAECYPQQTTNSRQTPTPVVAVGPWPIHSPELEKRSGKRAVEKCTRKRALPPTTRKMGNRKLQSKMASQYGRLL
jgi:hypothetical protein